MTNDSLTKISKVQGLTPKVSEKNLLNKQINAKIIFRPVQESDIDLVIKLYESRDKRQNSQNRTFEEQKKFVNLWVKNRKDHIYQYWYVIVYDGKDIGTITTRKLDNEWGIWLLEEFRGKGLGVLAGLIFFKTHKKKYYTVYIFSYNKASIRMCEKLGFHLISQDNEKLKYIKK